MNEGCLTSQGGTVDEMLRKVSSLEGLVGDEGKQNQLPA